MQNEIERLWKRNQHIRFNANLQIDSFFLVVAITALRCIKLLTELFDNEDNLKSSQIPRELKKDTAYAFH